jgi:uncharacterized transporter YbjL
MGWLFELYKNTVYPLTTLLRILSAQVLAIVLFR